MTKDEFKQKRKVALKNLEDKIVATFSENKALAIHQFGSAAKGTDDEFSDLDLWITLADENLDNVVADRDSLYASIGEVVLKFEPPENAPIEGMYSLIVFEMNSDLYQVDFYLAPKKHSKILPESKPLFGEDNLPRGDWFSDFEKLNRAPLNTPESRIDYMTFMAFIGVKYVVREFKPFLDLLVDQYNINKTEHFPTLGEINNGYDFKIVRFVLDQHYPLANEEQKRAIDKIKKYLNEVESLYS